TRSRTQPALGGVDTGLRPGRLLRRHHAPPDPAMAPPAEPGGRRRPDRRADLLGRRLPRADVRDHRRGPVAAVARPRRAARGRREALSGRRLARLRGVAVRRCWLLPLGTRHPPHPRGRARPAPLGSRLDAGGRRPAAARRLGPAPRQRRAGRGAAGGAGRRGRGADRRDLGSAATAERAHGGGDVRPRHRRRPGLGRGTRGGRPGAVARKRCVGGALGGRRAARAAARARGVARQQFERGGRLPRLGGRL
ncbi:MAG: hypothetical protein AVDCRST_MAG39-1366, partial [uncultured Sphingomonadaceae bacterium]